MILEKEKIHFYVLIFLTFISFTFLNKVALILMPLYYLVVFYQAKQVKTGQLHTAVIFMLFLFLFWAYQGFFIINNIVSILMVFSFLMIFHLKVDLSYKYIVNLLKFFTVIMLINSFFGFIQYALYRYDDAFIGLYGRSGLQGHGLAIIYALLSVFYYFERSIYTAKASIFIALVFFCSFVLCFYGTGVIHLFVGLLFILMSKLTIGRLVLMLTGFLGFVMIFANLNPITFEYNMNILFLFYDSVFAYYDGVILNETPRRILAILNYFYLASNDILFFVFGSSPGTFNSRTSFLLNGDYSTISSLPISIHPYAAEFIFPLWNPDILGEAYSDGSMNQPFSSILAVLAEFGLIFFIAYFTTIFRMYRGLKKLIPSEMWFFILGFIIMLLLFENVIEYPEILFSLFLILQYFKSKPAEHSY